ncbi:FAD-binding oxidoreductase [Shinella sp. CPCC 100929]|uniref:FAD-binding oxidoreductase n=1 Tax=Shinella lacus TaxID=2654216 RepID=A0ABT1RDQ6_9HYPH|nr:FAD-binding oxidoreductase [Shinella lacus]
MPSKKVAVVGAGIVGLSVAYALVRMGASVTVIDRDAHGGNASSGNAGGVAVTEVMPASIPGLWKKVPGWLLDPLGPLAVRPGHAVRLFPWLAAFARAGRSEALPRIAGALASINERAYDDLAALLRHIGMAQHISRTGALTVYEKPDGLARDRLEWETKRGWGIEVIELSASEVRELEPALGPLVACGLLTPQWGQISDPKVILDGLRTWLISQGVTFLCENVERIIPEQTRVVAHTASGDLQFETLVIAAGAWSAQLLAHLGDRVLLESERGYNTTIKDAPVTLRREIIFADRKFVATPLSSGLRLGGAAEFGGLSAKPNMKRCQALLTLAAKYLPGIKGCTGSQWSGHRPATPDSLPVIGRSYRSSRVIYAFGHGHLGLTQAATTGKLVSQLVSGTAPSIDLTPFSANRFAIQGDPRLNDSPYVFLH